MRVMISRRSEINHNRCLLCFPLRQEVGNSSPGITCSRKLQGKRRGADSFCLGSECLCCFNFCLFIVCLYRLSKPLMLVISAVGWSGNPIFWRGRRSRLVSWIVCGYSDPINHDMCRPIIKWILKFWTLKEKSRNYPQSPEFFILSSSFFCDLFYPSFCSEMTKGSKFGTVSSASRGKDGAEEKEKRSQFCTRIGTNFNPRTTKFHNRMMLTNTWWNMASAFPLESILNSVLRTLSLCYHHPTTASTCILRFKCLA